ncbi:MAG TPA: hypothetical protein VMV92_27960 [Streptosporangiaceae bacterium]|nr:hypothetical protein [Streptosporangiaceae bacterium]
MDKTRLTPQLAWKLVEAAVAAPSIRNTQPWRFTARPADQVIELSADPARMLRGTDPDGRAVHISCGAALFNLRLAATCASVEPVTRLLPQPRDPQLLATVRLAGRRLPRPRERDLYAAIWRRHTTRAPLRGPPVRMPVLAALGEAAELEGTALFLLDDAATLRVSGLATAAQQRQSTDPDHLRGRPQLAVITTRTGSAADWLRAGQALQRVLLLATQHGIVACPLSEALDIGDPAVDLGPGFGGQRPQLILRLGYGPQGPPTPRRPVSEVLRIAAPVPPRGGAALLPAGHR